MAPCPAQPSAAPIIDAGRGWSWRGWLLLYAGLQFDRPALRLPLVASTIYGSDLPTGS